MIEVNTFHVVVQTLHTGGPIELPGTELDLRDEPEFMTNGFRIVFRRVFSRVFHVEHEPIAISWMGLDLHVLEGYILHVDDSVMEGLERESYVTVLKLGVDGPLDEAKRQAIDYRHAVGMSDAAVFDELRIQLIDTAYERYVARLEYVKPDLKLRFDQAPSRVGSVVPLVLGFYLFGLLTLHRIDRAQVAIQLPTAEDGYDGATMRQIAELRVRITNVNRYFLTTNRSVSADVKEFCKDLAERLDLQRRYERQAQLNRNLERHLDNISQLAQAEAAELTNRKLMFITLLGVPIALFSALAAFSFGTDLVSRPIDVISSTRFWLLVIASVAFPWFLYWMVERLARARRSSRCPAGQ
ncbi:MAG: hypothetical protein JXE06_00860 [Coriobacteriia bacterium]|nr:hypothetical protein [Coriobacteriia bacterium]